MKILKISKKDYEDALVISDDEDVQIHYKKSTDSCFRNNFFRHGLMAWEENMDMQPVFNN